MKKLLFAFLLILSTCLMAQGGFVGPTGRKDYETLEKHCDKVKRKTKCYYTRVQHHEDCGFYKPAANTSAEYVCIKAY